MALDNQENMQDACIDRQLEKCVTNFRLVRVTPPDEIEKNSETYVAGNNRSDLKVAFYFSEWFTQ